jgi:hypothetical protein
VGEGGGGGAGEGEGAVASAYFSGACVRPNLARSLARSRPARETGRAPPSGMPKRPRAPPDSSSEGNGDGEKLVPPQTQARTKSNDSGFFQQSRGAVGPPIAIGAEPKAKPEVPAAKPASPKAEPESPKADWVDDWGSPKAEPESPAAEPEIPKAKPEGPKATVTVSRSPIGAHHRGRRSRPSQAPGPIPGPPMLWDPAPHIRGGEPRQEFADPPRRRRVDVDMPPWFHLWQCWECLEPTGT